jgi:hypothetical protein
LEKKWTPGATLSQFIIDVWFRAAPRESKAGGGEGQHPLDALFDSDGFYIRPLDTKELQELEEVDSRYWDGLLCFSQIFNQVRQAQMIDIEFFEWRHFLLSLWQLMLMLFAYKYELALGQQGNAQGKKIMKFLPFLI